MNTSIITRDLTKQAPHSPRERIAGFAIASRAVDKCRASLAGTLGEYHYDCPLDNMLFSFEGSAESKKCYTDLRLKLAQSPDGAERAVELAVINGRSAQDVSQSD